jgi:hypothetical protein
LWTKTRCYHWRRTWAVIKEYWCFSALHSKCTARYFSALNSITVSAIWSNHKSIHQPPSPYLTDPKTQKHCSWIQCEVQREHACFR